MTSWFGSKVSATRKSPRPSPTPKQGLLNSGSLERPIVGEMKLESTVEGLYNPLAWDNMPSSLREKFPHWKDSSCSFSQSSNKEDGLEDDRTIYSTKSSKQPPCTIPYVVMERDTIQGIAVKFETTPSEIARINKKPTLTFSIFPGDLVMFQFPCRSYYGVTILSYSKVLYVPDQDELAKLAPPPTTPTSTTVTGERPVTSSLSSVDSEATPTITAVEGGDTGEGMAERVRVETSPAPSVEVADDHISILSKYISDDQGCIHGNLVVNKSTLMFTPNSQDPLVKEHGVAKFEIVIPVGDVIYAAVTHTVTPPKMCPSASPFNQNETPLTTVNEEHGNQPLADQDGGGPSPDRREKEGEGGTSTDERVGDEPVVNGDLSSANESREAQEKGERKSRDTSLTDRTLKDMLTGDGGPPSVVTTSSPDDAAQVEPAEPDARPTRDIQSSIGKPDEAKREKEEMTEDQSTEDMLAAIMGAAEPGQPHQHSSQNSMSSDSVSSLDALLADSPYFLHVYVNPKSPNSYTYTPINSTVGIDIPRSRTRVDRDTFIGDHLKKSRSLSPPVVQHVKNQFCFAVIDKRLDDLVECVSHHSSSEKSIGPPSDPKSWTENNVYEFINTGVFFSNEDLSFRDDHFQSSSWEIYSLTDVPRMTRIDRMEVEYSLPLPSMSEKSDLLLEDHIRKLMLELPSGAVGHDWWLIYSTFRHGISLRTLYRSMMSFENEDSPILLIVRDEQKKIFGAAVTCRIRISEKFIGTGESFLFMFDEESKLKVYPWTGVNNYVVKGNTDSFSIGSGDGHPGLWLDESFYHGASYSCSTFNNECLASSEDFICSGVEAWGFS